MSTFATTDFSTVRRELFQRLPGHGGKEDSSSSRPEAYVQIMCRTRGLWPGRVSARARASSSWSTSVPRSMIKRGTRTP